MDFGLDFGVILDAFWDQNLCNFFKDFRTCYFCDSGAATGLRQGRLLPRCPPGGALLFEKKHPITTPGSQDRGIAGSKGRKHCRGCFTRDLTCHGPLARRIYHVQKPDILACVVVAIGVASHVAATIWRTKNMFCSIACRTMFQMGTSHLHRDSQEKLLSPG